MLKRSVWRPIALAFLVILLLAAAVFFLFLLKLDILIADYLLLVVAVAVLFVYVAGVLLFFGMHRKRSTARRVRRIIGILLSVILTAGFLFGAVFLKRLGDTKQAVTVQNDDNPRSIVGIYVKTDDPAQTISDMADYRFAVLSELGDEKLYANYALGKINENIGVQVEAVSYPGILDAIIALRADEVQVLAVSKGFLNLLNHVDGYEGFNNEVRLVEEITVPHNVSTNDIKILVGSPDKEGQTSFQNQDAGTVQEKIDVNRPVVMYLSGMDKYGQEIVTNAHADVNILMAINPTTKQILLVSTPRDFYVVNHALGGKDKLTHCGLYGVSNSIASLNELYKIKINNYCRINFTGFDNLIELIGGVTIDNPVAFRTNPGNGGFYFEQGTITLSGYEALCYAKERDAFGDGDLARGRNQVRIISGVINKVKSNGASLLMNYPDILDALAGTFETDLTSEEISDLAKIALANLKDWEVKTYSAWGYSGKTTVASMGMEEVYIIWPNDLSVNYTIELFDKIMNDEYISDAFLASAPAAY